MTVNNHSNPVISRSITLHTHTICSKLLKFVTSFHYLFQPLQVVWLRYVHPFKLFIVSNIRIHILADEPLELLLAVTDHNVSAPYDQLGASVGVAADFTCNSCWFL